MFVPWGLSPFMYNIYPKPLPAKSKMVDLAPSSQKMNINKTESEYNMKSIRFLLLTITALFMVIAALMVVLGITVYSHYHNFTFFFDSAKTGHFITPSVLCVFLGLGLLVVSLFGFFGSLKRSTCMVNTVIAALMVVLGITVYSHYHNFTFFFDSAKTGHFITPSVLCVFLGLGLLVVSLFGFFGSLKRSTCMVNTYALLLGLILILKLVVVILTLSLKEDMIRNYIYIPMSQYAQDPEVQDEIDTLQTKLGCCGFYSYLDYINVEFTGNHSTVVVTKENELGSQVTLVLPASCCVTAGEVFCTRMWSTSCQTALVEVLIQNATVLGVLGISVMFINLLGIIFALLLARCIRKSKSEKTLMQWKIKEQFILAREAEEAMKDHVVIETQASSNA